MTQEEETSVALRSAERDAAISSKRVIKATERTRQYKTWNYSNNAYARMAS